jgi:hypothetical protein
VLGSDPLNLYLDSGSHGQKFRSTPGPTEPTAKYFFKNSTWGGGVYRMIELSVDLGRNNHKYRIFPKLSVVKPCRSSTVL